MRGEAQCGLVCGFVDLEDVCLRNATPAIGLNDQIVRSKLTE